MDFPAKLLPHLERIRGCDPDNHSVEFNASKWREAGREFGGHLGPLEGTLAKGEISRADIIVIGTRAAKTQLTWETFFLAVMIWGYGSAGYGPHRTAKMYHSRGFSNNFSKMRTKIEEGPIQLAYECAGHECKIDRLGSAFFTKLFYFLGKVFERKPLPLILDARVAKSLKKCEGQGFSTSPYFYERTLRPSTASQYVRYVQDMNRWAIENEFEPDQLELFLFDPPDSFNYREV